MSLNTSGSFQWDDYLERTHGIPAPKACFKQYESPPANYFEPFVLLEAVDQRSAVHNTPPLHLTEGGNPSPLSSKRHAASGQQIRRFRAAQFALATVVEIWGPRIRVRLVGTDDRNDCWFLVDSDQIRPYPSGDPLQPPFGYMYSHSIWNRTLRKAIDTHRAADPSWFIKPPPSPPENLFCEGQKLEAVDRHNAQLICPASVGALSGVHIQVSFDGWSGAFDYWTRYDSRDLLPVGWCKLAGHPLQSPGQIALKNADKTDSHSPSSYILNKVERPERPSSLSTPQTDLFKKKQINKAGFGLPLSGDVTRASTPIGKFKSITHNRSISTSLVNFPAKNFKDEHSAVVSSTISPIPSVDKLKLSLKKSSYMEINKSPQNKISAFPNSTQNSTSSVGDSSSYSMSSSSCSSADHSRGSSSQRFELPKVKHQKRRHAHRHREEENGERRKKRKKKHRHHHHNGEKSIHSCSGEPLSKRHNSESINQQIYVETDLNQVSTTTFSQGQPSSGSSAGDSIISSNKSLKVSSSTRGLTPLVTSTTNCATRIGSASNSDASSLKFKLDEKVPPDSTANITKEKNKRKVHVPSEDELEIPTLACTFDPDCRIPYRMIPISKLNGVSPPNEWSIDDVYEYISTKDPALLEAAEMFRHHEIDGQALLLLQIKSLQWMNLKFGPALKIDHLITLLKKGYY